MVQELYQEFAVRGVIGKFLCKTLALSHDNAIIDVHNRDASCRGAVSVL